MTLSDTVKHTADGAVGVAAVTYPAWAHVITNGINAAYAVGGLIYLYLKIHTAIRDIRNKPKDKPDV